LDIGKEKNRKISAVRSAMGKRGNRNLTFLYLLSAVVMSVLLLPADLIAADLTLRWDPNQEEGLAGYKIHYKEKSYGEPYDGKGAEQGDSPIIVPLTSLADPENPQFRITGLADNKIFFVVLTAFDDAEPANESEYSNVMSNLHISHPAENFGINKSSNHKSYTIHGHGLTEASIQILGNGVLLGVANTDPNGNFTIDVDFSVLGEGVVELKAKQKESTAYPVTGIYDLTNPQLASWDLGDEEITLTFDERHIQNAYLESSYRFNPSLTFRTRGGIIQYSAYSYLLSMTSIPDYEIISLEMTGITDEVGNPLMPASITINDRDEDQMADDWEVASGLDPTVHSSGADIDGDGFSNLSEYQARTDPHDSASAPIVIADSIPQPGAGILNSARVPEDTSLAVLIASVHGIDLGDEVESGNSLNLYWVVYDRALETILPMTYSYDGHIHLTVEVDDLAGNGLPPALFEFNVESEEEHILALSNIPEFEVFATANANPEHDSGAEVVSGELEGARIEYSNSEPLTPVFGPLNEIGAVAAGSTEDVGLPLNLLPHTVFDKPVKIFIPAPAGYDVSEIGIYYNNGAEWLPACDKSGNLLSGGEGWMVAGSRVNHPETTPPLIEIQVHHFSAVQGAVLFANTGGASTGGVSSGSSGSGAAVACFIDTAANGPGAKPTFSLLALLWVIGVIGLLPVIMVYRHHKRNGFYSKKIFF
jgi:hypothetical protein